MRFTQSTKQCKKKKYLWNREYEEESSFKVTKGLGKVVLCHLWTLKICINVLKDWQSKITGIVLEDRTNPAHISLCRWSKITAADEDDINYMLRKLTETYEMGSKYKSTKLNI